MAAPDQRSEARLRRSAARLAAVQALFQMESSGQDYRETLREFEDHRLGQRVEEDEYREPDLDLFRDLVRGAVDRQAQIDQAVDRALDPKWPITRIDPTLRALFRVAGYELAARSDTPYRVAISEYVDIAKAFFPEGKEPKFVNGVLDTVRRSLRPEG